MHLPGPIRAFVLLFGFAATCAFGAVPQDASSPPKESPKPPVQQANPPAQSAATPQQATTKEPAKPKPRKIITNDDIEGGGSIYKGNGRSFDFGDPNDCDRSCFDSVRNSAHVSAVNPSQWEPALLDALDRVRQDGAWQTLLANLTSLKSRACTLQQQKQDDLSHYADPRNVTHKEIDIDKDYDRQYKALEADTLAFYERVPPVKQKHTLSVYEPAFMDFQVNRIVKANCPPPRQQYQQPDYNDAPSDDANDP